MTRLACTAARTQTLTSSIFHLLFSHSSRSSPSSLASLFPRLSLLCAPPLLRCPEPELPENFHRHAFPQLYQRGLVPYDGPGRDALLNDGDNDDNYGDADGNDGGVDGGVGIGSSIVEEGGYDNAATVAGVGDGESRRVANIHDSPPNWRSAREGDGDTASTARSGGAALFMGSEDEDEDDDDDDDDDHNTVGRSADEKWPRRRASGDEAAAVLRQSAAQPRLSQDTGSRISPSRSSPLAVAQAYGAAHSAERRSRDSSVEHRLPRIVSGGYRMQEVAGDGGSDGGSGSGSSLQRPLRRTAHACYAHCPRPTVSGSTSLSTIQSGSTGSDAAAGAAVLGREDVSSNVALLSRAVSTTSQYLAGHEADDDLSATSSDDGVVLPLRSGAGMTGVYAAASTPGRLDSSSQSQPSAPVSATASGVRSPRVGSTAPSSRQSFSGADGDTLGASVLGVGIGGALTHALTRAVATPVGASCHTRPTGHSAGTGGVRGRLGGHVRSKSAYSSGMEGDDELSETDAARRQRHRRPGRGRTQPHTGTFARKATTHTGSTGGGDDGARESADVEQRRHEVVGGGDRGDRGGGDDVKGGKSMRGMGPKDSPPGMPARLADLGQEPRDVLVAMFGTELAGPRAT